MPIHSPSSLQQAITQIQKSAGIKVKIQMSAAVWFWQHRGMQKHIGNATLEAEGRCTVKRELFLWCVVKMLCFLCRIDTLQCLIFALLLQLKELSSLLLLSLERQERRISVYRAPTVNSGTWELIWAAVLPLPWQKNGCILIWFPF